MGTYETFDSIFETMRYPAGESHVRLRADIDLAELEVIEAMVYSFDDLAQVITADRIIRRLGHTVEWFLPYFPFARHDRRNDRLDGFELGLAIEMVAELSVVIADPHSDVSGQLRHFDQAEVVAAFERAGLFDNDPVVIIPDAGAAKKTYTWLGGRPVAQASKRREPATGKLSGFSVPDADNAGKSIAGRPCIIIDDIVDGGGTFLGLAAELQARGAGPLTLAVTHGLFTKGTETLAESFTTIASMTPTNNPEDGDRRMAGVITIPFQDLHTKGTPQ